VVARQDASEGKSSEEVSKRNGRRSVVRKEVNAMSASRWEAGCEVEAEVRGMRTTALYVTFYMVEATRMVKASWHANEI